MRVLFLTERFPYPLHDGGSLRSYHIIRALAREHRVTVLTQGNPMAPHAGPRSLDDICDARFVPRGLTATRVLANLARRGPQQSLVMLKHWSDSFLSAADEVLAREPFDVVHCNHLDTAFYVLQSAGPQAWVFDTHNCLHQLCRHMGSRLNGYRRFVLKREARALEDLERRVLERMSAVFVCSETDAGHFARLATSTRVVVVPNGVNTEYFAPWPDARPNPGEIVFTGNMGYFPNQDAMVWFRHEVVPRIRGMVPKLRIIGGGHSRAVRALHDGVTVEVVGPVPDVRPHIASAEVFVAPLRFGSGTRLKILEAMAMGKAVVSTPKGAEGLEVTPGKDILTGETAAEFADQLDRLRQSPALRDEIGRAARASAAERFDWSYSAGRLLAAYAVIAKNRHADSVKDFDLTVPTLGVNPST